MTKPGDDDQDRSSPWPILIALGIGLVVLAIVGITKLTGGDDLSDQQLVTRTAVAQNDALQRNSYAEFQKYTCTSDQGNEADVLARQRQSTASKGARYVDEVTGIVVTGDQATATVVYHFEHSASEKLNAPMTFIRQDGAWKVCSPGPS